MALPPAPLVTNMLLSFDASASADPDAGDSVASFAWAFRAPSGEECAPPVVAGTGPLANVRFGCPGRYAVDVTATDEMGASSTATKEFDVAAYAGPALVTIGSDISVDHACSAAPLCTPSGPVTLSASAPGFAPGQVQFAWTVEPPAGRPLTPSRRVSFSPSAAVASPMVAIETDGDAIAGDWLFRVVATDAAGVVGTAAMRVSVGNQPPSVAAIIPLPGHAFDGSKFSSAGEVPFTVSDPDGDPLVGQTVEWHHAGDGASAFSGVVLDGPPRVSFQIAVPYAGPDDAFRLIGGAGLERTIQFAISDVNGARTAESWPIVVGNRAPVALTAPGSVSVDHGYDAVDQRYIADATVATWADPDGDPLFPAGPTTNSSACASYDVAGGDVVVHCSAPYPGTPHPASIMGSWPVSFGVGDPWTAASTAAATVQVLNRVPRIAPSVTASVSCGLGACCRTDLDGQCTAYYHTAYDDVLTLSGAVADDDGDPLVVTVNGTAAAPCLAASCTVSGNVPQRTLACGATSTTDTWTIAANDGAATASGTVSIVRRCQ